MQRNVLSNKVRSMTESATLAMAQKARDLRAKGHDVIALSIGEPDFDTPVHIKEAAKDALDKGWTKYTPVPGLNPLKEAIRDKFARDNKLHYELNQIVVSNGAKQSIANVCLALLDPGDEVIIFTPYWVSYYDIVSFAGGKPVLVKADISTDFKITAEQLEEAITDRTQLIIFSSPCNPTGSVYTQDELTKLADVIRKYENLYIVSDEIYEYINFTGSHFSIGSLPGMIEKTITVNGFSKGFAMTGWRLGYLGAPAWLAAACTKIQGQVTSGATSFGQMAGAFALTSDMAPTHKMAAAFLERRDMMISLLNDIPGFTVNKPMGAFYIFPDISALFGKSYQDEKISDSFDLAEFLLTDAHVAVVAGGAFGDNRCVRISYAASNENLREAVRRIKQSVAKLT